MPMRLLGAIRGSSLTGGRAVGKVSALWLACVSLFASADDTPQVTAELVAEVREELPLAAGGFFMRYRPAAAIVQGQTVFYTVRIRNPTPVPLRGAVTVQRIPANTSYVLGSAAGPGADIGFSLDGGQTFVSERELRTAGASDGAIGTRASQCTHIRWQLRNALAPGATALARFQAIFQ